MYVEKRKNTSWHYNYPWKHSHYLQNNLGVSGVAVCEEHTTESVNGEHPQGNPSTHYCHMCEQTEDLTSNVRGQLRVDEAKTMLIPILKLTTTFAMKTLMHRMNASSMRWWNLISAMVSTRFRDTPKIKPTAAIHAWAMVKAGWMPSKRLEQSGSVTFSCIRQLFIFLRYNIVETNLASKHTSLAELLNISMINTTQKVYICALD